MQTLLRSIYLGWFSLAASLPLVPLPAQAQPISDEGWKYTTSQPGEGWYQAGFDDRSWKQGAGGFGTSDTPGSRVGTDWDTDEIWLRREVQLPAVPDNMALLVHHDEDAVIYLNGVEVASLKGYVTQYKLVPLSQQDARQALRKGSNLLAVHCRQTGGGQFIDVHLVDADKVRPLPPPPRSSTPFQTELLTRWGSQVTAATAWQSYPRPNLAREDWQNLNGHWDYAVTSLDDDRPTSWDGKILVPFCLESKLSGVQRLLHPDEALWYHRTIELQPSPDRRLMLNFEAVDYRCRVWLNDTEIGEHVGGNLPFRMDITDAARNGRNQLVVRVEDATGGAQLRGKQRLDPRGIWYTRVSGIWQTVWLEELPHRHVEHLEITTSIDPAAIRIQPRLSGPAVDGERLRIVVRDGRRLIAESESAGNEGIQLPIDNPKLWSPSQPHLYSLDFSLLDGNGKVLDQVGSYAGIREVGTSRDAAGHLRFTLNGQEIFHWGTLDQGWWPDGLLTPPSDAAMLSDIEVLKAAGFNMIRKHIKVEPRRYYYHCDKLGMLVWQDQVSGGTNPKWTRLQPDPQDAEWDDADHRQFMVELDQMMTTLGNHPSIVVWVPFNEAWGQHRTTEVGKWTVERDPTRIVNIASGGNFWPVGHVVDEHRYPHPGFPFDADRYVDFVKVVGEFGGHGWPVEGHLWNSSRRNWGYGGLPKTIDEFEDRYRESIRLLAELKAQGIAAGVYTQTTDVEGEINGLITYDRTVVKIPTEELKEIHRALD